MRIQHNLAAVNAQRQLLGNNNNVGKNLEKLSSGFRINRAADDAAGLGISEKMRCQIAGLDQAQSNSNDGISLVQTAEGALTEVHGILNRMTELATQSANGTYDDKTDRANLQKEVSSLVEEVDRIAESTDFNGIPLLNGNLSGSGAMGAALTGSKIADYKPATVVANPATNGVVAANIKEEIINIDGADIKVDWSALSAEEQSILQADWPSDPTTVSADQTRKAAQAMEKAINTAIDKSGLNVEHVSVFGHGAEADPKGFTLRSGHEGGTSQIVFKNNDGVGVMAFAGTQNAVVGPTVSLPHNGDMDGDFVMSIDGHDFAISTGAIDADGSDIVARMQAALNTVITNYNAAVPDADQLGTTAFVASLNDKGQLEISNTSGKSLGFKDVPGGETATALGITVDGKASGSGLVLQVGDTAAASQSVTVSVGDMRAAALGIGSVNIDTQGDAKSSIAKITDAIRRVSEARGGLGAVQNRLEHTINSLGVTSENMVSAESRIRDVDMANEMMDFTKNNILSQAAQSMLAQANQLPQGVLQLLQ